MSVSHRTHRSRSWPILALVSLAAATITATGPTVAAAATPTLQMVNAGGYTGILANSTGLTLYLLNTEKGAVIHCHPTCLKTWVPVEVPNSVTTVTLGTGVKGVIGFVARTSTRKQVTFNSYPLYHYIKDTAAGQIGGQDLSTYAGTWLVVHASTSSAGDTPFYPTLQSMNAGKYTGVLANHSSRSLYLLTTEKGAVIHCTGTCLKFWFPLEVPSKTTPVLIGRNVNGHVGLVQRGPSLFQVTFNSYPTYTYVGDKGPGETNGEGRNSFGGLWFLMRAAATTVKDTPITPS